MTDKQYKIPEIITVGEFAALIEMPVTRVITELMNNGVMATINDNIDYETAEIIADYLGISVEKEEALEAKKEVKKSEKKGKDITQRPPVVAVMGHVDHGKTSILDAIRDTNIVSKESGGITQHIGAYQVEKRGKKITFLDTPGHAAFEKMREHGARITDIAVIVVAADEGVKPQTIEAIKHARNAGTTILIAINKIDKPEADLNKIKGELAEQDLASEDWGGNTITVPVSAKKKTGLDDLLEMILLQAEVLELECDPKKKGQGIVIESHLDKGKGPVATILVQDGTLYLEDYIQIGGAYGKIRSMEDHLGRKIKKADSSVPVRISGIKEVPTVASLVFAFDSEKEAKEESEKEKKYTTVKSLSVKKIGVDEITKAVLDSNTKELEIVLKADVKGSLEAVKESLGRFKTPEVAVKITREGLGDIKEQDVMMASTTNSKMIFGFNVNISSSVLKMAEKEKVRFSKYTVIYELLDDIKKALEALLPLEIVETETGRMEILKVFSTDKKLTVAGGRIISGMIVKDLSARILRKGEFLKNIKITTVRKEKNEVTELKPGEEGGLGIEGRVDIQEKDIIQQYKEEEIRRTL